MEQAYCLRQICAREVIDLMTLSLEFWPFHRLGILILEMILFNDWDSFYSQKNFIWKGLKHHESAQVFSVGKGKISATA